jgi:hypothetical protein
MKRVYLLIAVALISGIAFLLGWSNTFAVSSIHINESDKRIAAELNAKLMESPAVIKIGEPIARVDRRAIQNRLRSLIWVDQVTVNRDLLSGIVEVSVTPRSAIAQLDSRWNTNPGEQGFLSEELEFFFVSKEAVEKAARSGERDWRTLPTLSIGEDAPELKGDVATILDLLVEVAAEPLRIDAEDRENLTSRVLINGRNLDISWGSVKELELKKRVLLRLLELKANRNAIKIDLTSPLSPIVK